MASIKDIAQELGVSTTTVSLVLTGKYHNGRISKDMVEKVLATAKKLNYHPNLIAKSLKSGSTKTIGLVVADITNPYFAQLVFEIQNYMLKFGYTTLIMNTNENVDHMKTVLTMLVDRQVDGFIVVPTLGGENSIKHLMSQNYPLVLLDRYYEDINTCNVLSDNYKAMYSCVEKLINKGKKNISFISIDNTMIQVSERLRGFSEAMQSHGLYNEDNIYLVDYNSPQEQTENAINKIINTDCDTIIIAINRLASISAKIITQYGKMIGRDIDIVYFDNTKIFDLLPTPTAHITQPIEQLGKAAAEKLLQQINSSPEFECKTHLFECKLHNL